jgi:hypothetical protein
MNTPLYSIRVYVSSILFLLYSFVVQAQQDIAVIKQNDKYGLIDSRGKILLPCMYDELAVSCSDLILCKQGDKYGFIDRMGRTQIAFEYEEAGFFYNDTTWVKKEGKVGFIDRNGTLFIDYRYEETGFFSEGLVTVNLEGQWGIIDSKANYVLYPEYDFIFMVRDGYAIVDKNNKQTLWSRKKYFLAPLWHYNYIIRLYNYSDIFVGWESGYPGSNYLLQVISESMSYLTDKQFRHIGNIPQTFLFDRACSPELNFDYLIFRDTLGLKGVLNPAFKEIINGYQEISYLSPYHFLCTKQEGYYDPLEKHIYDTTGALVGDFSEYAEFGAYREGKLLVCKNEKWGMVDFQKNTLLPLKYEELTPFKNGVAMARIRNKYYLIDERGKRISKALPCDALSVVFYENLMVVQKGNKYGAIDYTGKLVLPVEYDQPITFYPMSIFVEDFK